MKYIDADKLIAEIERRLKSLHEWKKGWERRLPLSRNKTYYKNFGKESAYDAILNIITSLQQEQPELPANLDEAASKYESNLSADYYQDSGYTDNDVINAFKAGAEWMAGRDKEKIEQAFFSGYNECEDRMKKEFERSAMAGEVNNTGYPTTIQLHTFDSSLKNGDKVNIIIIKQEQD